MRRHVIFIVILSAIFNVSFAATNMSCTPVVVKVENKNIILPGPQEQSKTSTAEVYFFNNISKKSFWLDHPVDHPSASAGWSSYLRPGNWSAMVVNRKNFTISCAEIQPGKVDYQDCAKTIAICMPKQMEVDTKHKGSYWLVEDKSWDEFVAAVKKHSK